MEHEWLIGLGIQTLLFLSGGYAMVLRNDWSNTALKEQINDMRKELEGLASVIITQAVQTTRLDNLFSQMTSIERRVEDMRRGSGFVKARKTVDGEYDD